MVISSYLPEIMALSDRILVSRQGKVVEEFSALEATEEKSCTRRFTKGGRRTRGGGTPAPHYLRGDSPSSLSLRSSYAGYAPTWVSAWLRHA